ncbi:uncharacterized protein RCC_08919 [Ramularia collo-cygni]|uniref:Uncharacterized protein n=1 Tax=Ramularia collo-cygni TaxID=112498 RepID=A0A2D3VNA9_9PEZI|nr:uncharacterized protein RCC_08919 [Ramularia collo-cygni]CZT23208.1 uncharacterized protein RCC_08919 [Ramularia collo-cygni]
MDRALLPSLSRVNGHALHSGCFQTHLIDATKLNTYLNQVEEEQAKSDQLFDGFQSSLVDSETRAQMYEEGEFLKPMLVARIAAAEAGKLTCFEGDAERKTKLVRIRRLLRTAVTGVFEAFDEVLNARSPTATVSDLDIAVAKAKACWKRLSEYERAYLDLLKTPGSVPGTTAYSDALEVRKKMAKSLEATRRTYRVLENELLAGIAAKTLGDRAFLVQPMSEENMAKLANALNALPTAVQEEGTPQSLTRRSHRDSDGRPSGEVEEELPPVDDRSRAFARWYRGYVELKRAAKEPLTQVRAEHRKHLLDCKLVYPNADIDARSQRFRTTDGRSFKSVELERINSFNTIIAEGMAEIEAFTQNSGTIRWDSFAGYTGFSGETFWSDNADGNASSEAYLDRVERLRSIKPYTIRKWCRDVVKHNGQEDMNDMNVSAPSSIQEMRAAGMSGFADYGDEPVTDWKLILKGGYEAITDLQRWQSSIDRTLLLRAINDEFDGAEEMELQGRAGSGEANLIMAATLRATYSADAQSWIVAP